MFNHKEIEKIGELLGEDFWKQNYIYNIDFLIELAISRTAENLIFLNQGCILHCMENPEEKLKYHDNSNKKLEDLFSILDKAFVLTEKEPNTENLKLKLLNILKEIDNKQLFSRSYLYERILNLCKKIYTWKYISRKGKSFTKKFAKETIDIEIPMKKKYSEFFDDKFDISDDKYDYTMNDKNKKEKIGKREEKKEKERINKKDGNPRKKKKNKIEQNRIDNIEEIDGYIEDF